MKHGIKRIISGTLEPIADWVCRKPLLALILALLLIKSFPIIAMVLLIAIGIAFSRTVQQPVDLAIEVNPV